MTYKVDAIYLFGGYDEEAAEVGRNDAVTGVAGQSAFALDPLIISEFRLRGPNGANDEFVEIYNNSDLPHTVVASSGTGYALAASDGTIRFTIPNGTTIPARGHYLGVNSVGYSLASYPSGNGLTATGNATYTTNIPENVGLALFNTSVPADFTLANRFDAVGSTAEANTLFKEGAGYPSIVGFSIDCSLVRQVAGGCTGSYGSGNSGDCGTTTLIANTPGPTSPSPVDTNNNAADFIFVDTNGTSAGAGQRLGAPGPENIDSPVTIGNDLAVSLLDPAVPANSPPNQVRDFTSDPANNSTFGTLDVRRKITNNTGAAVTRLRFRVLDVTTFPSISGVADLRPRTSTAVVVTVTGPTNVTVQGTTLEQPPSQPNGGGYNSSMSAGIITLATPLADGASIDLRFLLGIQQTGIVRFGVALEALPGGGGMFFVTDGNVPELDDIEAAALAYTENHAPMPISSTLTVTDADSPNLASATVSITGNFAAGQDALGFTNQNGITGSYNAATGVLTLTGSSTQANYRTALRSVTYSNSSENPNTATRTVRFQASDGTFNSNLKTRDITVASVNDAPVLAAIEGTALAYTENAAAIPISATLTAADVDTANLASAAVSITGNFAAGQDVLGFANQNGITGSYNAATGVLTLTGSASLANYQTALRSVTYSNSSDNPSTATRTVSVRASDGIANGNTVTRTIALTAINDAPVAVNDNVSVDGTKATIFAPGVLGNDTDAEGSALQSALGDAPAHGVLTFNTNGSFIYTAETGYNGTDTFTYRASDGTVQSNAATVTLTITNNRALTVTAPAASVEEGATLTGTVTLSTASATDVTVNLTSSDSSAATVPATVTIPAGQTTATFAIQGVNDDVADGAQPAVISVVDAAATASYGSAELALSVTDADVPTLTLTVAPGTFNENAGPAAAVATLSRNFNLTSDLPVQLGSSDTSEITMPTSLVIPSGARELSFFIGAIDDRLYDGPQNVDVLAIAEGYPQASTTIRVLDNGYVRIPLSLTVNPGAFLESAGQRAAIGQVSVPAPGRSDYVIELSSSDESEARVPRTVTIRAGRTSASFLISAIDDGNADSVQPVTITARRIGFATASKVIKVGDDDEAALVLTVDADAVQEDGTVTATVVRNRSLPFALTVLLSSSDPSAASVPAGVTVPAGQASATFTIRGVGDSIAGNTRTAIITASRPGSTADSATLNVVDGGVAPSIGIGPSRVALSTATARAATGSIVLVFDGALDAATVSAANFAVSSGGNPVAIEAVAYNAATSTVILRTAAGSLHSGDRVNVAWQGLLDTQGSGLQGKTSLTVR